MLRQTLLTRSTRVSRDALDLGELSLTVAIEYVVKTPEGEFVDRLLTMLTSSTLITG